jgi:hypothetical protein
VRSILLAGLGEVGVRAARQLLETSGVDRLVVAARPSARVRDIAASLGSRAEIIDWNPGDELPDVDAVASALPSDLDASVAQACVRAGVSVALATDRSDVAETIESLDQLARASATTVVVGAGLAPGLTCVLARHAAALFDDLIEVRVARVGVGGPASEKTVRDELRPMPLVYRGGRWKRGPRLQELIWFPEPIGARDCQMVGGGGRLLAAALAPLERLTWSQAEPVKTRKGLRRVDGDDGWGSVRVEVFGRRDGRVDSVVYGVVDRAALAAGAVLAATVATLAGLGNQPAAPPGVHSLAGAVEPKSFLADLTHRGVRAAVFEGAPAI